MFLRFSLVFQKDQGKKGQGIEAILVALSLALCDFALLRFEIAANVVMML